MNLRDALLSSLKDLPGTREFHLHVLLSAPRKHSDLFPFAEPRPKVYLQDVLLLLSERSEPEGPRVLVTAVEACVYSIPITSCAILYVSKVDSTGQASSPSPTSTLVRALLSYYADPATRPIRVDHLWIHVFARAQGQYLFPCSSEYSGKRPLSDARLCAWWRRTLTDVVVELGKRTDSGAKIKMYYVLPGYNESEASHALRFASGGEPDGSGKWMYGHPYTQTEIPLPCPAKEDKGQLRRHLGHCIPSFDDDPKNRFMAEIAYTTEANGIVSPRKKRIKTFHGTVEDREELEVEEKKRGRSSTVGDVAKVTADEFWERMSFRQECVAGAMTGFFTVGITCPLREDRSVSEVSPLQPLVGQVSASLNKRIMTDLVTGHEFSTRERAIWATEALEMAIRGLCDGIAAVPVAAPKPVSRRGPERANTPEQESREVLVSPSTPPPRHVKSIVPEVSPNPFPEPVNTLDTYRSHIYGSIALNNSSPMAKGNEATTTTTTTVTVLTVRKRKKS